MLRKILIIYIMVVPATFCFGQNLRLIDSIRHQLATAQAEKKFHLLNDLAWEYRWAYPDSTMVYASKAYELGQQLHLQKGLAEPLNFMGIAQHYKAERLLAYEYYDKALTVSQAQSDSIQIAHTNNNIGRLLFEQGLLSKSYSYFVQALEIFEILRDSSGLAYTYQSLANLYRLQKDFEKSESHYLKAYRMRVSLGNTRDIMSALEQLGRLYQETGQHKQALKYLHLADSAGRVINDAINLAEIKTFIAESYLNEGFLKEADEMVSDGLQIILKTSNVRMVPQAYLIKGEVLMKMNDVRQAKKYFLMALDLASRTQDLTSKMEAHYFLWKVSQVLRDKEGELLNYNQYLILKDSIKDLDLAREVERLQFEIEISRKQQENELLKANEAKNEAIIQLQRVLNIIQVVVIGFVTLMFIMQWRNSRKRRMISDTLLVKKEEIERQREEIVKQNEKLSRRNIELSELNNEKDTLMGIVAHDLKSPLNRIKGITDLMEMEGGLTPDQRHYIRLAKESTQAGLDLITDLLDVNMIEENVEPLYSTFDIGKFLEEKTESFRQAANAKRIQLNLNVAQSGVVVLDIDYVGRIVDNLISNAIKFSDKASSIDISAGLKEGEVWIAVKDSGQGFSEEDKAQLFKKFKKLSSRPTAGESSNGLGLAIVKILVDRLKGRIELKSQKGKGSEFTLWFPVHP